jgi:hypothetical protein
MLRKSSEMEVAIELCAERVSEKTEICDEEAEDPMEASYGP